MLHMHQNILILIRTICVTLIISQVHIPLTSGLQCLAAIASCLFFHSGRRNSPGKKKHLIFQILILGCSKMTYSKALWYFQLSTISRLIIIDKNYTSKYVVLFVSCSNSAANFPVHSLYFVTSTDKVWSWAACWSLSSITRWSSPRIRSFSSANVFFFFRGFCSEPWIQKAHHYYDIWSRMIC